MEYPTLNVKQKSRQMLDTFLGYNHNLRISDSEFYDMENMTADYYPVLAPRKKRGIYKNGINATGLIAKDQLCYVDGTEFVIGDERIEMGLSTADADCPKDLISMGAYVIIMPDKKYINTIDKDDWGCIEESYESAGNVTFTLCSMTGDVYSADHVGTEAPAKLENGMLWIDTSTTPHTLKKYSSANAMWATVSTTYVAIEAEGINEAFSQYDGVKISGVVAEGATDLNGSHAVWACSENKLVVTGMLDKVATQAEKITVTRKMPIMDFIVESGNRLWGCRYGENEDGEVVNEIYASKLGDFKNWNCFMNLSTDSYSASCGTDGKFTGAIVHLGYPLFFKEGFIHKVYGDYPANFQIQSTACRGVERGSHKSLAIVGETLFYKSSNGVCAYDGSLPVEMSAALGEIRYSGAVAGAHGNKYYITMKNDGKYHLFAYDTTRGMWHKEDNLQVDVFCSFMNEMYAIDSETKNIITLLGTGGHLEEDIHWMAETGLIGMSMPDMKYITRLLIRMALSSGASVGVEIQYDSMGEWEPVYSMKAETLRSFAIPVRPRRCDHFRLRFAGEGACRIFSITKTVEQGSDIS